MTPHAPLPKGLPPTGPSAHQDPQDAPPALSLYSKLTVHIPDENLVAVGSKLGLSNIQARSVGHLTVGWRKGMR